MVTTKGARREATSETLQVKDGMQSPINNSTMARGLHASAKEMLQKIKDNMTDAGLLQGDVIETVSESSSPASAGSSKSIQLF